MGSSCEEKIFRQLSLSPESAIKKSAEVQGEVVPNKHAISDLPMRHQERDDIILLAHNCRRGETFIFAEKEVVTKGECKRGQEDLIEFFVW